MNKYDIVTINLVVCFLNFFLSFINYAFIHSFVISTICIIIAIISLTIMAYIAITQ